MQCFRFQDHTDVSHAFHLQKSRLFTVMWYIEQPSSISTTRTLKALARVRHRHAPPPPGLAPDEEAGDEQTT
ncbi:unnamed protein product [Lactuca virosa]|uniref:Uncharacterized protein n=1 Tax=Lactuca virosa TaxID=75947 RepID=A0AAU9N5V7_9ASTR|nr:unnamed protein product [Lactuca virosa]CAH1434691.1 unnamed protein product [Lactuca virosa]